MTSETVKGFKDYTGKEALKRAKMKKIIEDVFTLYGFEPAETPIIENRKFVQGENQDDEAVSNIFKLEDRGKRKLALRYELTFPLKRISKNKKLPYKRYQIGPVFRDEPVSANRFRQFTQCDVDTIGSTTKDDAEILSTINTISKKLGFQTDIYINNRKLMNEILEEQRIKEKHKEPVIREIDKLDKLSEKQIKQKLKKYKAENLITLFKKPESYFEKYESYQEIEQLKKSCKLYGLDVKFSPSLARGLSYYTETVFEGKVKNSKNSFVGGGAYLINGIRCIGYGIGLERLSQIAKIKLDNKQILIISIQQNKKATKLSEKLRKNNISAILLTDKSISKALDYANSKNIPYVIFLGQDEVKKNKLKLRDMKTGKQESLSEKQVINKLKNHKN